MHVYVDALKTHIFKNNVVIVNNIINYTYTNESLMSGDLYIFYVLK